MRGKVDIFMMTKNSAGKPMFENCLRSIRDSDIPINRFIVIDGFSTDETCRTITRFFPEALIVKLEGNLSHARTKAVEMAETEWLAFIDSDVTIPDNWYSEMCKYKAYGDGLESWNWNWGKDKVYRSRKGWFDASYRVQGERALTIADLIRTKYIKGLKIPEELFELEDDYIRQYIMKRGGIWIKTGVKVDHYPHDWGVPPFKHGYLMGKYMHMSMTEYLIKALGNIYLERKPKLYYWKMLAGVAWGRLDAK